MADARETEERISKMVRLIHDEAIDKSRTIEESAEQ